MQFTPSSHKLFFKMWNLYGWSREEAHEVFSRLFGCSVDCASVIDYLSGRSKGTPEVLRAVFDKDIRVQNVDWYSIYQESETDILEFCKTDDQKFVSPSDVSELLSKENISYSDQAMKLEFDYAQLWLRIGYGCLPAEIKLRKLKRLLKTYEYKKSLLPDPRLSEVPCIPISIIEQF